MTSLTINGISITAAPGTSVLDAARQNGIDIPSLCHHSQLRPVGMCRLCVVEIQGQRGLPTACTTPVAEGMSVQTDSPAVQELRREILTLTIQEHPYTCLVCGRHERCNEWQVTIRKAGVTTGCENCPRNGQCELQALVEKVGLEVMPYPITYRGLPVEHEDPFFDRDYNLCVICGRCVRACQEVRLNGTLAFHYRGSETRVGTAPGLSHLEAGCEFCGACVDVCPTGALYDKRTKWEGVPDLTATTICPYCSVGCELEVWAKNGRVMGVRPSANGVANQGQACTRGRFGIVEVVHASDRIKTPLVRKEGQLVQATWEEALKLVAERLGASKGGAFALLGSPHLTTESAYALQKFARRVMRSPYVDSPTALPRHLRAAELRAALLASRRGQIQSLRKAGCVMVVGANPCVSHPVVALQIRQALHAGAKLIVIDPRETDLAEQAQVWLRPQPGTDGALLAELKAQIATVKQQPVDPANLTQAAARLLVENGPVMIVYGSGVTHYANGPDTIRALQALAAAVAPEAQLFPLMGASNTYGVLEAGLAAAAGTKNYTEILAGIAEGTIKALYLAGEMPPLEALDKLDFLVVQDLLLSDELRQYTDVFLPAATFAEMSGTLTNLEGRAQHFAAAIPPQGQARPDWLIVAQIAQAMSASGFAFENSAAVLKEMRGLEPQTQPAMFLAGGSATAPADPGYPVTLILERNQYAYRGAMLTEQVKGMEQVKSDEDLLVLHPDDAARINVGDGDLVRLISAHGADTLVAQVSAKVLPGAPFASINALNGSAIFAAGLPDLKACAVRLEKADEAN
jgi:formate dehydrogenase (NADP+) alpha subunit